MSILQRQTCNKINTDRERKNSAKNAASKKKHRNQNFCWRILQKKTSYTSTQFEKASLAMANIKHREKEKKTKEEMKGTVD